MKKDTYEIVTWPEIQALMDLEGFRENAFLVNDEKGMEAFGSSAYFVSSEWLAGLGPAGYRQDGGYADEASRLCERMFDDLKARMKALGLGTLRLDGRNTVYMFDFDLVPHYRGIIEMEVHGAALHEDMIYLRLEPFSQSVKIVNEVCTSPSLPEGFDPDGEDWIPVGSDILDGYSLFNIDESISEALLACEQNDNN